ncbi:MAG: hypothetical protein QM496_12170 [Verrucomicrobiota bacterium]
MSDEIIRNLYILAALGLGCAIWFRHPFPLLIAFVSFSLTIGEYYPFSNFPMYSDPDDRENYFVLSSIPGKDELAALTNPPAEGNSPAETPYFKLNDVVCKPLPSYPYTGLTAPTLKKMFKSRMNAYAKKHGTKRQKLNAEQKREIGVEFLAYVREQAMKSTAPLKNELPDALALVEFWIEPDTENGGFIEKPSLIARLSKKQNPAH